MNFVPSSEKAKEWGISQRRVAILCKEGRVPGAELVGNRWFLPSDAVKPQDPRKAKKDELCLKLLRVILKIINIVMKSIWTIGQCFIFLRMVAKRILESLAM